MYLKIPKSILLVTAASIILNINLITLIANVELIIIFILFIGLWHVGSRPLNNFRFLFELVKANSPDTDFVFIGTVYARLISRVLTSFLAYFFNIYISLFLIFTFIYLED